MTYTAHFNSAVNSELTTLIFEFEDYKQRTQKELEEIAVIKMHERLKDNFEFKAHLVRVFPCKEPLVTRIIKFFEN